MNLNCFVFLYMVVVVENSVYQKDEWIRKLEADFDHGNQTRQIRDGKRERECETHTKI